MQLRKNQKVSCKDFQFVASSPWGLLMTNKSWKEIILQSGHLIHSTLGSKIHRSEAFTNTVSVNAHMQETTVHLYLF